MYIFQEIKLSMTKDFFSASVENILFLNECLLTEPQLLNTMVVTKKKVQQ